MLTPSLDEWIHDEIAFVADLLAREPDTEAVILVGSGARGLMTETSDIDFVVFTDGVSNSATKLELPTLARRVEVAKFQLSPFLSLPNRPEFDQKSLCDAGRLATGRILYRRTRRTLQVVETLKRSVLTPPDASALLAIADVGLRTAESTEALTRLRAAQGAAFALAQLKVSLMPSKYQKPKWLMQDLWESDDHPLASALQATLAPPTSVATEVVQAVREFLALAMDILDSPFLTRTFGESYEDLHLRQTFRDAVALLSLGQQAGCIVTSLACSRLVAARLRRFSTSQSTDQHAKWEEQLMRRIYPSLFTDDRMWSKQLQTLRHHLRRLEATYSTTYRHPAPR